MTDIKNNTIFGEYVEFVHQAIAIVDSKRFTFECQLNQFYLNVPDVARFLALPERKQILIEKAHPNIENNILNTWLMGTVIAYHLQFYGYLVLHGSAILMKNQAVILSGQSGAGKSTLANALVQKGYSLITDDLVVIKRNAQQQYCIIPGPSKLKLWKDAMQHFNYDINKAAPVGLKVNKYVIPIQVCNLTTIPIAHFYELNIDDQAKAYHCEKLDTVESLKTLMQNAYRYFMLKPLGRVQNFFYDCSALCQQIIVHKLIRTTQLNKLNQIIEHIEMNLETVENTSSHLSSF